MTAPEAWTLAMARKTSASPSEKIPSTDSDRLQLLCDRAEDGELIYVVPPGLDAGGNVLLHYGALA